MRTATHRPRRVRAVRDRRRRSWRLHAGGFAARCDAPISARSPRAYLGLTARRPSSRRRVGGSVVLGYLDRPHLGHAAGPERARARRSPGSIARATQQRIFVRGTAMTIGFSAFVARVRRRARARSSRVAVRHAALAARRRSSSSTSRSSRSRPRSSARSCGGCSAASTPRSRARIASATPRSRDWRLMLRSSSLGGRAAGGPALPELHRAAALGRARRRSRRSRCSSAGCGSSRSCAARATTSARSRTSSRSATCRACAARSSTARASRSPTTGPAFNIYATPKLLTTDDRGRARAHARPRPTTRSRRSTSASRSARSAIRRAPILVLEDQGRDRAALVEQALRAAARRRGPPRAVSLLPAGRPRGAPRRLHDADDRRRGRPPRRRRATTPSELVGRYGLESRVGELPARQEGRRALRGRRARPAPRRRDRARR